MTPDDMMQYIAKDDTKGYGCTICNEFYHSARYHVRNHIESKHFPSAFTYTCQYCNKQCNTRKALENHVYKIHKNVN